MIATALRTGGPLPQITPCPLVDRYLLKYHGLNVIHSDAEDDYGLPRTLSLDTLQDEQYMWVQSYYYILPWESDASVPLGCFVWAFHPPSHSLAG